MQMWNSSQQNKTRELRSSLSEICVQSVEEVFSTRRQKAGQKDYGWFLAGYRVKTMVLRNWVEDKAVPSSLKWFLGIE